MRALDECLSTTDRQAVTPGLDLTRLRNEFNSRLVQHLDRQASLNQILAREAASKTAQLSILTAVADVLVRGGRIDTILTDILARTLNAAGVSIGAIYLASEPSHDRLVLACQVGYPPSRIRELSEFFERRDLLDRAMASDQIPRWSPQSELRGPIAPSTRPEDVSCTLLVPLAYAGQRIGVLYLAAAANRPEAHWGDVARALSVQIAQAVTVARSIEQLSVSEDRYRTLFERVPVALLSVDARRPAGRMPTRQWWSYSAIPIGRPCSRRACPPCTRAPTNERCSENDSSASALCAVSKPRCDSSTTPLSGCGSRPTP